jgi:hypothetical protein
MYGDSTGMNINKLRRLTVIGCNSKENDIFKSVARYTNERETKFSFRLILLQM